MSIPSKPRKMRPIPITAAEVIAKTYGYDQVVIIARRVGEEPEPHGDHLTTYGINPVHCEVAAKMGNVLKRFMGWQPAAKEDVDNVCALMIDLEDEVSEYLDIEEGSFQEIRKRHVQALRRVWESL